MPTYVCPRHSMTWCCWHKIADSPCQRCDRFPKGFQGCWNPSNRLSSVNTQPPKHKKCCTLVILDDREDTATVASFVERRRDIKMIDKILGWRNRPLSREVLTALLHAHRTTFFFSYKPCFIPGSHWLACRSEKISPNKTTCRRAQFVFAQVSFWICSWMFPMTQGNCFWQQRRLRGIMSKRPITREIRLLGDGTLRLLSVVPNWWEKYFPFLKQSPEEPLLRESCWSRSRVTLRFGLRVERPGSNSSLSNPRKETSGTSGLKDSVIISGCAWGQLDRGPKGSEDVPLRRFWVDTKILDITCESHHVLSCVPAKITKCSSSRICLCLKSIYIAVEMTTNGRREAANPADTPGSECMLWSVIRIHAASKNSRNCCLVFETTTSGQGIHPDLPKATDIHSDIRLPEATIALH